MKNEQQKFYICKHCGNIIGMIENSGVPVVCCGENMTELVPNTTDASQEKHVPVIKLEGSKVTVNIGSAPHPMTEEHHISWVYILTEKGGQRKILDHTGVPSASFMLTDDDKLVSAFAYCNLHGLWKADA
ncbi:MAG: desulfoferrodoxin family protein [Oscillospiraceae bacterium]|nr:desulfoferrodoxin family protein [Oscillospiraceae bacterium]